MQLNSPILEPCSQYLAQLPQDDTLAGLSFQYNIQDKAPLYRRSLDEILLFLLLVFFLPLERHQQLTLFLTLPHCNHEPLVMLRIHLDQKTRALMFSIPSFSIELVQKAFSISMWTTTQHDGVIIDRMKPYIEASRKHTSSKSGLLIINGMPNAEALAPASRLIPDAV